MQAYLRGWGDWWEGQGVAARYMPGLAVIAYWPCVALLGGFRSDHALVGLLVLVLGYGGRALQRLLLFLVPLMLTGVVYHIQRYVPAELRGAIHVAGPYQLELALFGIPTAAGVLTPNEWWQMNLSPLLDLVTGFCYLVFIPQFVLTAAFFTFVAGTRGTALRSASFIRRKAPEAMWGLLLLNVLGYVTHIVYPVAPPWYTARYGFGAVHPGVAPDAAGAARFDQMLGVDYFAEFYGRSVDAFGAIPSLHVAFSALALYYALRLGALRAVSTGFFVAMCFSAVYLNHHYIIDVVWGVVYAVVAGVVVDLVGERRAAASQSLAGTR